MAASSRAACAVAALDGGSRCTVPSSGGGAGLHSPGTLEKQLLPNLPASFLTTSSKRDMQVAQRRRAVTAQAGSEGVRSTREAPQPVADKQALLRERNRKLLAMQKELLDQIEERKKLHAALLDSLDNPSETIKAFNGAENGVTLPPQLSSSRMNTGQPNYNMPPLQKGSSSIGAPAASSTSSPPTSPLPAKRSTVPPSSANTPRPSYARKQVQQPRPPAAAVSTPPRPAAPPQPTIAKPPPTIAKPPPTIAKPPPAIAKPPPAPAPARPSAAAGVPWKEVVQAVEERPPEPSAQRGEKEKGPPLAGENVMNVVVVAAECAPWSKTGGLGDVAGALPKALARRGHRVMVIAPRYENYDNAWETGARKHFTVCGQSVEVGYFHSFIDGVDFVFVDSWLFHQAAGNIYGGSRQDIVKRCMLLCKAALEAPFVVACGGVCYGDNNLVFVANDWHTALLPVYLQAYYRDNNIYTYARSVLVIHNMAHQGRGPVAEYPWLDLPPHYLDKFKLYDPVGGEHMNIFMAGLITAHRLVAVSHGYAWECQTEDGGWGLHNVIRDHGWKMRGVVNGIDTREWSPESDTFLKDDGYRNYGVESLKEGKAACKAALQRELGLPVRPEVPLLGFIGRLDYQKGVDIIMEAMGWLMSQDVQLVMLGSGRQDLEDALRSAEASHRDKCRGWVGFSVKMAHRITAGCDILLMPSRFEPCGLNQLYAMRYGTVPVVHSVGGLRDTVQPFNPFENTGTGWTFEKAEAHGLIDATGNALYTFRDYPSSFKDIQLRGMTQDLSWDNAAQQYEEVLVAAKYQW